MLSKSKIRNGGRTRIAVSRVRILFIVLIIMAAFFASAMTAEAAGTPTQVIAFTDKKVYTAWWMDAKTTAPAFRTLESGISGEVEPVINIYAFVLDDDGNIMKNRTVKVTLNDTDFDHWEKNNWAVHSVMVSNNTYFATTKNLNDTGTGLYTTTVNMPSSLMTDVQANQKDDHIRIKIDVKDNASGLNSTTYVLVSWGKCHKTPTTNHPTSPHVPSTSSDLCTDCHGGYEHFFENTSKTIPDAYLDIHFKKLGGTLLDSTMFGNGDISSTYWSKLNWNSTQANNATATTSWKARSGGGAVYCLFCHDDPSASNWFDYGNGDRTNMADKPSCGQGRSGYSGNCHSRTEIENTSVINWTKNAAVSNSNDTLVGINNQKSHNHTTNSANVSCTLCHSAPHGLTMPNMSADISPAGNINNQCAKCHNITGGLNITSNGGTNVAHTNPDCKACHLDGANKLDAHLVPQGQSGGRNCTDCHDIGDDFAKVDVGKMNQSNSIHVNLNSNATIVTPGTRIENKFCWGCHTNNSLSADNIVNETELPVGEHPNGFDTPKKCADCHIQPKFGALIVSEHYSGSADINTRNYSNVNDSCINCHDKSEMMIANSDPGGPISQYANVSHYGDNKTGDAPYMSGASANCSYCHQNITSAFKSEMVDSAWNSSISNHTADVTNPSCTNSTCHNSGRIHNSSLIKPTIDSTLCRTCHTTKTQHNGTVQCSQCHLNSSRNIHPVQYLQQNGTWKINSDANKTTAVNCTNCHQTKLAGFGTAPIVPDPFKHSGNLSNGTIWGTYWTSENSSCYYCHNNTEHNATALGSINALLNSNNVRNGNLATTGWCSDCHYNASANSNYKGSQWNPVPPLITVNNTGKSRWVNHSGFINKFNDSDCKNCHALSGNYSATSLNYSHSLDEGTLGGPDCISCHDIGKTGAQHRINSTAMSTGIHANLNKNATNATWVPANNKKCWGCHDSTGTQPANDSMGSRFDNPYQCYDCHNSTKPYINVSSALTVGEHFKNGAQIRASSNAMDNSSSCLVCHNLSEMKVTFTEDDIYNSNYALPSHYGKSRTDLRTMDSGRASNCSYCHQNASTAFSGAMLDSTYNSSIKNHSAANAPTCFNSTCHNTGWLHNSSLTRPALPLPNTTFCSNCHADKQKHNNTQDCSSCHINTSSSDTIHPIKFIQATGSYDTASTQAANCTNCHQAKLPGFAAAPIIPDPLKHSGNLSNGTIWGTFWSSESGACYYCHSNTKHNATALGSINALLNSNNVRNGNLTTTGWCSDCHYNASANANYKGSQWSPVPPLITVNNTGSGRWVNHSSYVSTGYNDSKCYLCHALNGTYIATSLNYSHSLDEGSGASCMQCHSSPTGPGDSYPAINTTLFGRHSDVNKIGYFGTVTDEDCTTCHYNFNLDLMYQPGFLTPVYKCEECHTDGNFSAPVIRNHRPAGVSISTTAYCSTCHNNSINSYAFSVNASVGHYGTNTTLVKPTVNQTSMPRFGFMTQGDASSYNKNCNNCHNPSNATWGNPTLITMPHTSLGTCKECHVNGNASDLHNGSLSLPQTFDCIACHTTYAAKYNAPNITNTAMQGYPTPCGSCHGGDGANGIQDPNTHNTNRNYAGTPGSADTVYLNNQTSLTVPPGTSVTVTSRVNDVTGGASRVGGAEYYINIDPGVGKGVPMNPSDGMFDAVNGAWENVTGTIDTSTLSEGNHTVYVRGMDIGKQWSGSQSASFTVQSIGYINGTVTSSGSPVAGAIVSTTGASYTTASDGNYSLTVPVGTYTVTASKQPTHNDSTVTGVVVTQLNTTTVNFVLAQKPIGSISGKVTNT